MGYDVVTGRECADFYGTFHVPASDGSGFYAVTFTGGEGPAFCHRVETGEECKGMKYRGECRHATTAFKTGCFWHEQWNDGGPRVLRPVSVDAPNDGAGPCPACGGPTVAIRMAV